MEFKSISLCVAELFDFILIESQWNLNEFKGTASMASDENINRITVEFKLKCRINEQVTSCILIESQWNLNNTPALTRTETIYILIESQWNLNVSPFAPVAPVAPILIESQWNLNSRDFTSTCMASVNINRITVEFK